MAGLKVTPHENFMLAVGHEEPYWLPIPLFDDSVAYVHHGIMKRDVRSLSVELSSGGEKA